MYCSVGGGAASTDPVPIPPASCGPCPGSPGVTGDAPGHNDGRGDEHWRFELLPRFSSARQPCGQSASAANAEGTGRPWRFARSEADEHSLDETSTRCGGGISCTRSSLVNPTNSSPPQTGRRTTGCGPQTIPASGAICVVVDREVLDRAPTAVEDEVLRRARSLGLPCLPPEWALPFLLDAITEHNLPGAGAE
jgi:hypothetical protein